MADYPASLFDDPETLLGLLGSFWSETYTGRDQLLSYCRGVASLAADAMTATQLAADCLSRDTVPVTRTREWRSIRVKQSDVASPTAITEYGDGDTYGDGKIYGVPVPAAGYPVSAPGLLVVPIICDRMMAPNRVLCLGIDYTIRDVGGVPTIILANNPFDDPAWQPRIIADDAGNQIDAEVVLWLYRPEEDADRIYRHYGFLVNLRMPSSADYRRLVVAILDALTTGTSASIIDAVLASLTGVPSVSTDGETVVAVGRDDRGLCVITDGAAYRLPLAASTVVSIGDVVNAGDPLCDAYRVRELNSGNTPIDILAITTGPGLLAPGFVGDLTFDDVDTPLIVSTDPVGRTRVSAAITGFPPDVVRFWDIVHARGTAIGARSLAQLLDMRPTATTEPTAASLPPSINPLRFLVANFLRYNCFLITIRGDALATASGLYPLRLLRRVVEPHVCLIVVVSMSIPIDAMALDGASDAPTVGLGVTTDVDAAYNPYWDGPPTLRIASRTCV